jgi:hypothetical protein
MQPNEKQLQLPLAELRIGPGQRPFGKLNRHPGKRADLIQFFGRRLPTEQLDQRFLSAWECVRRLRRHPGLSIQYRGNLFNEEPTGAGVAIAAVKEKILASPPH